MSKYFVILDTTIRFEIEDKDSISTTRIKWEKKFHGLNILRWKYYMACPTTNILPNILVAIY